MSGSLKDQLAINGGTPVRTKPLPDVGGIAGRTFGDEELANLTEVIRSGKLFRFGGHFVQDFEAALAELIGMKHAVAVTSGTAAVHTALAALDFEPGDEVIVPPITDMGSVAPILALNGVPVFADVDERTLCMDPAAAAAQVTKRTRAIVAVHLAGNMCDVDALAEIARGCGAALVEDCAQAYLAEDKGRVAGSIGLINAFSLQQSKHISSGDGGAVVTNDPELASKAAMFMDKGWDRLIGGREYLMLGLNYRMNELSGAVATAQVPKVREVIGRRRRWAESLTSQIAGVPNVTPPYVRPGVKHSYWFYPLTWDIDATGVGIGDFCKALAAEGLPAGAGYIQHPIFDTPCMRGRKTYGSSSYPYGQAGRDIVYRNEDVPAACRAMERLAVVPINENFTQEDVNDMAAAIRKVAVAFSG